MSSSATLKIDDGNDSIISAEEWRAFCVEHSLVHSPQTVGGNVYYALRPCPVEMLSITRDSVQVTYTERTVYFSTYWMGVGVCDVARLAMLAWRRWGGSLTADAEVRQCLCKENLPWTDAPREGAERRS